MGVWLLSAVAAGLAAIGLSFGLMTIPAHERPIPEGVGQEAASQARIAFELLVHEFMSKNGGFAGTLRASDLRGAGASSQSLTRGDLPSYWYATVAANGTVQFCTNVPDRIRPALLIKGFTLESLTCGA